MVDWAGTDVRTLGCCTTPGPEAPVADLVGVDPVLGPLPFWLTISCSPLDNPRLEMGNSGINVKLLGGYPALTEQTHQGELGSDGLKVVDVPSCCEGRISVIL